MPVVNPISQVRPKLGAMGTRRSYRQVCGLAAALDIIGERWTMLIVRDLALGARRYGELLEGLPGIGEGLLAQRLRHLEQEELVQRTFSPEVGAVVYELTDEGRELWQALVPLTSWGLRRVTAFDDDDVRADWVAVALRTRLDPAASAGINEQYVLCVDDEPYTITAADGDVSVQRGEAAEATVRISLDLDTFLAIGMGTLSILEARDSGRTKVEGDRGAAARYTALLKGVT